MYSCKLFTAFDLILIDHICQGFYIFLLCSPTFGIQIFQSALFTDPLNCLNYLLQCFLFISNFVNLDILPFFWLVWLIMCITHSFLFKEPNLHHFYSFILFILLLYILLVYALDLIVPLPAFGCLPLFSKTLRCIFIY